jgi:type I restriction enzyme S subunit
MKLNPYPKYKDSGVEWLGKVPSDWANWKVSDAFEYVGSGTTPPSGEQIWYEGGIIPWVTTGELRENVIYETTKSVTSYALDKFSALRLHPAGSLVMAMYGATIGRLGILGVNATTNQACCVLSSPKKLGIRFTYYWLLAFKQVIIDLYATGGGQPNINQETITSLRIAAPKLDEQSSIVSFLDRETNKLDILIAKQEHLIELLQEKRQAVISHAVTKGLNPDAKMKDSGVEWLGMVPENWSISPFKHAVWFQEGPGILAVDFVQIGVPLLRISCIQGSQVTLEGCNYLDEDKVKKKWNHFRLEIGDLLISSSASMGNVTEVTEISQGSVAYTGIIRLRPKEQICKEFLTKYISSEAFIRQIDNFKTGTTIQHFGPSHLNQMFIGFPLIPEQESIVNYLDTETVKLDTLIKKAKRSIELAKEHRTALISAAVTGKIDVREAA